MTLKTIYYPCQVSILIHHCILLTGILQKGTGSTKEDGSMGRLFLCGCTFLQGKAADLQGSTGRVLHSTGWKQASNLWDSQAVWILWQGKTRHLLHGGGCKKPAWTQSRAWLFMKDVKCSVCTNKELDLWPAKAPSCSYVCNDFSFKLVCGRRGGCVFKEISASVKNRGRLLPEL